MDRTSLSRPVAPAHMGLAGLAMLVAGWLLRDASRAACMVLLVGGLVVSSWGLRQPARR